MRVFCRHVVLLPAVVPFVAVLCFFLLSWWWAGRAAERQTAAEAFATPSFSSLRSQPVATACWLCVSWFRMLGAWLFSLAIDQVRFLDFFRNCFFFCTCAVLMIFSVALYHGFGS